MKSRLESNGAFDFYILMLQFQIELETEWEVNVTRQAVYDMSTRCWVQFNGYYNHNDIKDV